MAVLRRCQATSAAAWPSGSAGRPAAATKAGVSRDAIRSLPPPIASSRPYSSTDHSTGRPNSRKVALNAGRWPKRSVSARTPSQSNTRAVTAASPGPALAAEHPDVVLRHLDDGRALGPEERRRVVFAGGARHVVVAGLHVPDLERR